MGAIIFNGKGITEIFLISLRFICESEKHFLSCSRILMAAETSLFCKNLSALESANFPATEEVSEYLSSIFEEIFELDKHN